MKKRRGEVVKVSSLFEKYRNHLRAPQQSVVEEMRKIIFEVIGIQLESHQLSYTVATRTLAVHAPGLIRQEIQLKKPTILQFAQTRLGVKSCPHTII